MAGATLTPPGASLFTLIPVSIPPLEQPFNRILYPAVPSQLVNLTGSTDNSISDVQITFLSPTPEPATLLLFGTTAAGLGLARWRQRRRKSSSLFRHG